MSARRCFKYQGSGHIACNCLNQKFISLAERETVTEEEKEEEEEEETVEVEEESPKEEATGADEGEVVVLRRA